MGRQRGASLKQFRERPVIRPDEGQPAFEPLERALDLLEPELLQLRRSDDDHDSFCIGKQLQDVLDHLRRIVRDRNGSVVVAHRPLLDEATIHGSEQHRRRGKKLLAVLLCERCCRPADRHDEIQPEPANVEPRRVTIESSGARTLSPAV